MRFKTKILSSLVLSATFLIGSIILPIVPCRLSPLIPNPIPQWSLCDLNPDRASSLGSIKEYWGYTTRLTDAYFMTLILVFLLSLLITLYFTRRVKK